MNRSTRTALLVCLLRVISAPSSGSGQAAIEIQIDRPIMADSGPPMVEPHLAVSPINRSNAVVAVMVAHEPGLSRIDCAVLATLNRGSDWIRHDLGLAQCGDPWVAFSSAGTAIVSVLGGRGIAIYRSVDGGITLDRSWQVDGAFDHAMVVVSRTEEVYIVAAEQIRDSAGASRSSIFIARSDDDGVSFEVQPRVIASNLSYEAITPVSLANGDLVIPFQDHHRQDGTRLQVRRSWLVRSLDRGETFNEPVMIAEGCNRRGPVGWPMLAAMDGDGMRTALGWICEAEEGNGILFSRSPDGGETWSSLERIDGQRAAWTKIPTLLASERGWLAAWFEGGSAPESRCTHLRVALLTEGVAWTPSSLASTADSCPDVESQGEVAARFPLGGDYIGAAWLDDSEVMLVWSDARTGSYRLYWTVVKLVGGR